MNPRQPRALATSSVRWGLSCEVGDEASMGVILGYMKLFGADAIGFSPLAPVGKRKGPVSIAAGKKSGGRPKGRKSFQPGTGKRKTRAARGAPLETGRQFIAALPAGSEFATKDLSLAMDGSVPSVVARVLKLLMQERAIKMVKGKRGLYRKAPHLKIVKAA